MPGTRLQVEKIEPHEKDKGITEVYLQEQSVAGKEAPMPILKSSEHQYEQMLSGSSSSNSSHNAAFKRSTSKNYETRYSTIPKSDDHSNMAQASSCTKITFMDRLTDVDRENKKIDAIEGYKNEHKTWLECQFKNHECTMIFMPNECDTYLKNPPGSIDGDMLNRIKGSMFGLLLGDALGAHVEFRPHGYLLANPVSDLQSGGTWGLEKGQFTDDGSMALCLANSLVARCGFEPYDQLVRYKWWFRHGYMSSTGNCFDIGAATKRAVRKFENQQTEFARNNNIPLEEIDFLSDEKLLKIFPINCGSNEAAGNGALMRLAPVPLFFYRNPQLAVDFSGISGRITHGDQRAYDACRYYGALIITVLMDKVDKDELLSEKFYSNELKKFFKNGSLHTDIEKIAKGSFKKKKGYDDGIRGKGYVVNSLEAALWAFWKTETFKEGAIEAVNLGDDTDTTAAIYGQLAGAFYGYDKLPSEWINMVYAKRFVECLCDWIAYEGSRWDSKK
ncbi:unnamed protein product [Rotaria sordida]|uniref:ADP-ribosylhydrolase ARH3 n=2 Tax=Rotaria sordida TaxID=392033 RepID=A0A814TLQ9_9BILA|nr:unnamed protein product [Rotaria sordida]